MLPLSSLQLLLLVSLLPGSVRAPRGKRTNDDASAGQSHSSEPKRSKDVATGGVPSGGVAREAGEPEALDNFRLQLEQTTFLE